MLLCLEIRRLGLGDLHARGQTCGLVGDFDVDLEHCVVGYVAT